MYLKNEWDANSEQFEYNGDYEALPYMYCLNMENNIRKLYALKEDQIEQEKKIIESCEFILELMADEIGAIDKTVIECYQILILAYKLFRIDEGDHELASHVLQLRILACIEQTIRYEDVAKMLFLLDDLLSNFDSVFYFGDFKEYYQTFYDYKILVKCRRYVKKYNYEAAYENYIELVKDLSNKNLYDFEDTSYKKSVHINWIKNQFTNLLKTAKIIGKLSDIEKQIEIIFDDEYSLLNEENKSEFKLLLECEQCFDNCNGKMTDITFKLINIFEAEYKKEKGSIRDKKFNMFMDFLVQVSEKFSYEENYLKIIFRKMIEINSGHLKDQKTYLTKSYDEDLIIAIFRMLSFEDYNEWDDVGISELLQNIDVKENIGKTFLIAPLFKWGVIENAENKEINNIVKKLSILYNKVSDLENYVKVKMYEDEKIAYYTSLQTLGYLLMDENKNDIEKCRLSIMNVGYMNDPNEGKVINEVLEKNINSAADEFYDFIDVNNKRLPKRNDKNLIFLKSFSDKVDRLTMWTQYGDKGNGVCVILNGKTFKNAKQRINLLKDLSLHVSSNDYDDYDLYKVIYWNKNDNDFWANGLESDKLNNKMRDIFELLENIFSKISSPSYTGADRLLIMTFLKTLFSKLKYLIKFEEYKDENETRLIFQRGTVNSFKDIEEIPDEETLKKKIYIHYPVQTIISEIILGPKNIESDDYIPFLIKRMNEINESSCYSTDIYKSAIDYR